jgi:hypothetical protein
MNGLNCLACQENQYFSHTGSNLKLCYFIPQYSAYAKRVENFHRQHSIHKQNISVEKSFLGFYVANSMFVATEAMTSGEKFLLKVYTTYYNASAED